MSANRMTASGILELLRVATTNMVDMQTEPELRARPANGEPFGLADAQAIAADLHEYFSRMGVNDPRLVALAAFRLSVDEFTDMLLDEGVVPADGDALMDHLLDRANSTRA